MKSKQDNVDKFNDDLNFMPLNIETPLDSNSSKFPLNINFQGISVTESFGTFSMGLPSLNLNPMPMPLNSMPMIESAPLTPYPENIPSLQSKTDTSTPNVNNTTNNNTNASTTQELEYPDESNDFLYSYNESRVDKSYFDNLINPIDILKNFDITIDLDSELRKGNYTEEDIDKILANIEKNNAGILATMKAYRIPYPISKLLIKKIIKISLDTCKR